MPGFVVRRAQTSIDLKNGQSFMMAGLLQSENNMTNQRIPGLGKLPVLGSLFSSKAYQRRETDLVIIVTPYLVKPIDPSKKPRVPTDATLPASHVEYFLGNRRRDEGFRCRPRARSPSQARSQSQVGAGHYPRSAEGIGHASTYRRNCGAYRPRSPVAPAARATNIARADGLTDGAGNTMAANTVMQMVDPWQRRRREHEPSACRLSRGTPRQAADEAAADKATQSTGTD